MLSAHRAASSLFRDLRSHPKTSSRLANQPLRPGSWNILIERRPVRRALASASLEEKPMSLAVSAAENMGLSGTETPTTDPPGDGLVVCALLLSWSWAMSSHALDR